MRPAQDIEVLTASLEPRCNENQKAYRMQKSDAIIRYIMFFFSLALYFILLPIVLSYSLGYHIDYHNFKIYKMGILSLKSAPSGASVHINGKLRQELTPVRIEELKPDTYSVEVKREGFYPWQKELAIRPNMVTRAEYIILFPVLQEMGKIGDYETINFLISDWPEKILGKKFSRDGGKFLYFNENSIWVVYLVSRDSVKDGELAYVEELLKIPGSIRDVFWHSGSNHIVFVVNKDISVVELGSE